MTTRVIYQKSSKANPPQTERVYLSLCHHRQVIVGQNFVAAIKPSHRAKRGAAAKQRQRGSGG